jgi:putative tryptophan/tyrosine transport system ATP-binding protein
MLTLNHLYKSFATSNIPILNDITLEITKNEFCTFIGNNGSGKSTLMKCIAGEYALDSGQIKINDRISSTYQRSKTIASVTQDINRGTIGELTLLENMILGFSRGTTAKLRFYHRYRDKVQSLVSMLDMNLEQYIDVPLQLLSGGQRQIIATLMAISSTPQILLLDEHTSALDPTTQQKLMAFIDTYVAENNITTLMITHNLEDALTYGNRLIMLHQGKIILDLNAQQKRDMKPQHLLKHFQGVC